MTFLLTSAIAGKESSEAAGMRPLFFWRKEMEIQMIDITKTHPFEGCPFKVQKEESCSAFF